MANEIQFITINAAGSSWVDSIPAAVSTGYQAQNTNIEAAYSGIDRSFVRFDFGAGEIVVEPSGPIDIDGVQASITAEVRIPAPTDGTYYIEVIPGATATQFSLQLSTTRGTFDGNKSGYYNGSNRILDWVVICNSSVASLYRNAYNKLDVSKLSFNGIIVSIRPTSTVASTFNSPGSSPTGLAYDASSGNLISCDNNSDTIYIHDGVGAATLSSFSSPGSNPVALTIDTNTGNLISADNSSDNIYVHDGISSTILSTLSAPASNISGLAFDARTGNLISMDIDSDLVYVHDGVSSTILYSFSTPASVPAGMAIDTSSGNLVTSDNTTNLFYLHSGITENILDSFNNPGTNLISGMTYSIKNRGIISCDSSVGEIYVNKSELGIE